LTSNDIPHFVAFPSTKYLHICNQRRSCYTVHKKTIQGV
jgi:hypothetical protein